ncbi:non-heme iron oxygenase ferredoxin subunit [Pseudarthrobacter sp. SL88]|uniref:Rieske (2Fe-2S) domain protein n=1 Tax=Pseudarthrobacter chlorophenolicus (strain ATCC 700700 / DSM 12829 / CIP 107037 / JCM 12360 / KCTC 9906 / NCIMB 13794 / A6) TaxID=452863 RepID=B8H7P3_PSECP|nr:MULTISPECIES: non-heme iron oxygenase ferredoxin subunit [Micrococcaceae]MDQ1056042.1 3-phenylpropionate/trans-cinnamate dioxygenase ferredoxin subunit [Arthrobacter sp. SORGH_AS_0212]ACL39823.1 Rieske (2Fe-2S) domain protein [Pseudarthrobacter chlorophenolicus A6]KQQ85225.1 non-heme iron oxygenase ferredoxin subunit [Arthrobacter sp. Leaf137]MCT9625448.1 non-heme iron oxygenase ferredoxin subunit [Pseudarthrobacter equi]MCY1674819.1 non-heme iron oxygenase ferredoxin subunit [Pseudarthroba
MSGKPKGELVCSANDIKVKQALRILIDDYPVAVVRDSMGDIHAIGDTCSHADISLSEGDVEGCAIECWGHGSQFDLRSGQPLQLPAYDPVPVFAIELDGDDVYVDVTNVLNGAAVNNY